MNYTPAKAMFGEVRDDGETSTNAICIDCIMDGAVEPIEGHLAKIDKPDGAMHYCYVCGARAMDTSKLEVNQPMIDFINSISTGAYLK